MSLVVDSQHSHSPSGQPFGSCLRKQTTASHDIVIPSAAISLNASAESLSGACAAFMMSPEKLGRILGMVQASTGVYLNPNAFASSGRLLETLVLREHGIRVVWPEVRPSGGSATSTVDSDGPTPGNTPAVGVTSGAETEEPGSDTTEISNQTVEIDDLGPPPVAPPELLQMIDAKIDAEAAADQTAPPGPPELLLTQTSGGPGAGPTRYENRTRPHRRRRRVIRRKRVVSPTSNALARVTAAARSCGLHIARQHHRTACTYKRYREGGEPHPTHRRRRVRRTRRVKKALAAANRFAFFSSLPDNSTAKKMFIQMKSTP